MERVLNYINGELRPPQSETFFDNINPSLGSAYSEVADSNESDVNAAVEAATQAFPEWSQTSIEVRVEYLRRLATLIGDHADTLAKAESIDCGKPLSLAQKVDIPRSRRNLEFFADALTQFHGSSFTSDIRTLNYTTYSPLGAVACISPWNLPLYLFTWKIAPALAAGNTVIAKPSEVTPMTAYLLSRLAIDAGLPPGVLNVVHGYGSKVGAPLSAHADVKAVSFTGSTSTGRAIHLAAAPTFKKVSLEMGGKNANIIFADADFDKAIENTVRSSFLNQGQICLCGSRIFIEKPLYEKFKKTLIEKTMTLQLGDPLNPKTHQGALVSEAHLQKVASYVDLALSEGGKILCGGRRASLPAPLTKGYFFEPTLIENIGCESRVNQEEIFGPVATLTPFENEDEVLRMANSTRYGLSCSIWTTNVHRAHQVSQRLEAGVIWVNTWMSRDLRTPFGGVKESGLGREGGMEALRFFSEVKNVCLEIDR